MFAARAAKLGQWAFIPKRRSMSTRFENANAVRVLAMDAVQAANSGLETIFVSGEIWETLEFFDEVNLIKEEQL